MENGERQKYMDIGRRIRDARDAEGLTQGQLAEKLAYQSATAISLIESGERKVKIGDLEKIAATLHCDMNYLLTGKEVPIPSVRTALRAADNSLDKDDINKIETFIEFVKAQKMKQQHGRGDGTSDNK